MWQEIVDQGAHFFAAFAIVAIAFNISPIAGGAAIGFALGFLRELTEGDGFGPSSCRDIFFWTLGGLLAGVVLA